MPIVEEVKPKVAKEMLTMATQVFHEQKYHAFTKDEISMRLPSGSET